jgi:hypothetical protein
VIHLQCTLPVLQHLACNPKDMIQAGRTDALLGNWTVTDFVVDRRHAFIFMSDKTLLSFLLLEGKLRFELENIQLLLRSGLSKVLSFLEVPESRIEAVVHDLDVVSITKTKDRSTMGNLRALVDAYQHLIDLRGGLKSCDLTEVILNVNARPQRRLDWATSTEITLELLGQPVNRGKSLLSSLKSQKTT